MPSGQKIDFFSSQRLTNVLLFLTFILHATVVGGLIFGIFEVKNKVGNVQSITAENIDSLVNDAVVASNNGRFASERMLPLMQEISDMVHTAHEFVVPTASDPKSHAEGSSSFGAEGRVIHRGRAVERPQHGAFGGLMDIDLSGRGRSPLGPPTPGGSAPGGPRDPRFPVLSDASALLFRAAHLSYCSLLRRSLNNRCCC